MNFDYFSKKTDPLLVYTGVPSSTGGTSVPANVGGQVTKGYTVVLNYALLKKEHLLWQVNATLRHLTSEYRNVSSCLSRFNDENKTKSFYLIKIITKEKTKSSDILTRKDIFALQNRKEMPLCE